jgi:hypothetical protein
MSGTPDRSLDDLGAVALLLGRSPAGSFSVCLRRPDGMPAVIKNGPLLFDGTPMPTRFWLVDPVLRDEVSRLEAAGGVRYAADRVSPDAVADAHARYAVERDAALPRGHTGPAPSGGVGGTRRGVKCLHAHLAWYLCGGDDQVGRWTADQLGVSPPSGDAYHPTGRGGRCNPAAVAGGDRPDLGRPPRIPDGNGRSRSGSVPRRSDLCRS